LSVVLRMIINMPVCKLVGDPKKQRPGRIKKTTAQITGWE
jgi:hypothetical protein